MAALIWATGCSSGGFEHVWEDRYLVAEQHRARGEADEARGHYAQLLKSAPDEERRRLIELELAMMQVEAGKRAQGLEALDRLWRAEHRDAHGAKAMWEAARLREEAGDAAKAKRMREALITRYPGHVWADLALQSMRREYIERGAAQALCVKLTAMLPAVRGSGMSQQILFTRAEVERDALKDLERALKTFEEAAKLDSGGPLADDAVWERAEIYRGMKDWDRALVELGRLAEPGESSWFVGSYDKEYADQARYDRGVILLEHKGDWRGAKAEFEQFLRDYEDSLLRDDAAWGIVRAVWQGEGEVAGKAAMAAFESEYKESRYRRLAEAIRAGNQERP